jgi:hypothetical protein
MADDDTSVTPAQPESKAPTTLRDLVLVRMGGTSEIGRISGDEIARLISEANLATGRDPKEEDQPLDDLCIELAGVADTLEALVALDEDGDPLVNSLWYLSRRLKKCVNKVLALNLCGNSAPAAYRVERVDEHTKGAAA